MAKIHNVFAVIRGSEEPDRYVLLGNHRDAWTYGAVDPNSGTAALLDIARRFSLMMGSGWRPRRTIVLCSWDAEEFGMVGNIILHVNWQHTCSIYVHAVHGILSILILHCISYTDWIDRVGRTKPSKFGIESGCVP